MTERNTTPTTGPDFVSLQVRDRRAAAHFYEHVVGLTRMPDPNPHASVFTSNGVFFAVRDPLPGTDLDEIGQLGTGIGLWFHSDDPEALHERIRRAGATIVQEPFDGPFGTTFAFADADGYVITVHGDA